jgi:predicted glycogen debranching enzyme
MLISNDNISAPITSISLTDIPTEQLIAKEWLLSNTRGGFCSSTLALCNTRRYHGLLVGSLNPPADRVLSLSSCLETLSFEKTSIELGVFEFDGCIAPNGSLYLTHFTRDLGVHFKYDIGPVKLKKSMYLMPDSDVLAIVYDFETVQTPFDFSVRPFVALRDFHELQNSTTPLFSLWRGYGLAVRTEYEDLGQLLLQAEHMYFKSDPQWWYNFHYRIEKSRGQGCFEDLWAPGTFNCRIDSPTRIVLWASFSKWTTDEDDCEIDWDIEITLDSLMLHEKEITSRLKNPDTTLRKLASAAGQFVVERSIDNQPTPTVLAGFPWFLDWGRDTFIALPGLLLETNRFKTAAGVLTTFASAVSEGMIPNRFDDYGGKPHYNSVDASLWFIHAAFEYLEKTADTQTFSVKLLPAIRWIVDSYRRGTRFEIHADTDKLITAGNADTQLTWMDAKCNGIAFTPRYGKAVEINALWHSILCRLADYYADRSPEQYRYYNQLATQVKRSFTQAFWNEQTGCLNDCVLPDGTPDAAFRPNQVFAVSLPHSPLSRKRQKRIIQLVQDHLLTPFGLRSLSPHDSRYIGKYSGPLPQRDAAYHNGTVWAFLIGPFIEAFLKVNDFSEDARIEASQMLQPLLAHLTDEACLGNISEIFDGDSPHNPKGCPAQAWSTAETLRAYKLINP